MATAVARRNSPRIGRPNPRTLSPMDSKKSAASSKSEETPRKSSPLQAKTSTTATKAAAKAETAKPTVQVSEPLAPPPRPAQNSESADYFSTVHSAGGSQFSLEPNPFEQQFGDPSQETPGKTLLPSVAALTSPAIPGASSTPGYNWGSSSLRSGPLSPAMLAGPAASEGYFDSIGRGFPTPNESSLRTGLTPGGGGSMFPAASPNSQALYQALQSGNATPGTVDFHRTALNAAVRSKNNQFGPTSDAQGQNEQDMKSEKTQQDQLASHDAEAANGLFMLAKGGQANNQFAMVNPQIQQAQQMQSNNHQQEGHRRNTASMGSLSGQDLSGQQTDEHEEASKPNTRGGKGKKTTKSQTTINARRKAEETPSKPSAKRAKGNTGTTNLDPTLEKHGYDDDDDDDSMGDEPTHDANGKKMTDEEKRKNFLERNRVAALKCRQRKKQWLANLQAKVELFSTENDALSGQVTQLREEIVSLKGLLLAHKDCPLGQAQGLPSMIMNGLANDVPGAYASHHANPYGMAMQNGGGMQPTMQRS